MYLKLKLIIVLSVFVVLNLANAQNSKPEEKPRLSPHAQISQTVGFTEIKVSFGRPGVKGRKIWGGLVPYNKVWRAGADEATKITFSKDVEIDGKKIPAGSYSFFILPNSNLEWILILNKVADQWGAFEYNQNQDILRVKVKPHKNTNTEWLQYTFTEMNQYSALLNMEWENLKVSLKISTK